MHNRELLTRFDLLKPTVFEVVDQKQQEQIVHRRGKRQTNISVGDDVLIDKYGTKVDKQVTGKVVKQTSPSTYVVKTEKKYYSKTAHRSND